MVIEPRSQVALMRDPLWLVAGMYFEWMACMLFGSLGFGVIGDTAPKRGALNRSNALAGTLQGFDVALGILFGFALKFGGQIGLDGESFPKAPGGVLGQV